MIPGGEWLSALEASHLITHGFFREAGSAVSNKLLLITLTAGHKTEGQLIPCLTPVIHPLAYRDSGKYSISNGAARQRV